MVAAYAATCRTPGTLNAAAYHSARELLHQAVLRVQFAISRRSGEVGSDRGIRLCVPPSVVLILILWFRGIVFDFPAVFAYGPTKALGMWVRT